MYADMMIEKAAGNDEEAAELWQVFADKFGQYEFELERYFDHHMAFQAMRTYVTGKGF